VFLKIFSGLVAKEWGEYEFCRNLSGEAFGKKTGIAEAIHEIG
jgi:hypothetical protein